MAKARTTRPKATVRAPEGWSAFYRVVRKIPRGRVSTYGAVAALADRPRSARHVGFALAALRDGGHGIPWHRVLGARGRSHAAISLRDPIGAAHQRKLLEGEGVKFDVLDRVPLAAHGWPLVVQPSKRRK